MIRFLPDLEVEYESWLNPGFHLAERMPDAAPVYCPDEVYRGQVHHPLYPGHLSKVKEALARHLLEFINFSDRLYATRPC